jgi:hypothetical protein
MDPRREKAIDRMRRLADGHRKTAAASKIEVLRDELEGEEPPYCTDPECPWNKDKLYRGRHTHEKEK